MKWYKDDEFIRGKVPMTKFDIRVLSCSELELEKKDKVLDIGGGTGPMTIQMSECADEGHIFTIEKSKEALELIYKNKDKFNKNNISIIDGEAPFDLPNSNFDKVFIGGSSGKLEEIFDYLNTHLNKGGKIAMHFILLENAFEAIKFLKLNKYKDISVKQVSINNLTALGSGHFLKPNNPIIIISGKRV